MALQGTLRSPWISSTRVPDNFRISVAVRLLPSAPVPGLLPAPEGQSGLWAADLECPKDEEEKRKETEDVSLFPAG